MPQNQMNYEYFTYDQREGSLLERLTIIEILDSKGYDELHYIFPVGRHHLAIITEGEFKIYSPNGEYDLPQYALSGCFTWSYHLGAKKGKNKITIITFNPVVLAKKFGINVASIAHQHVDLNSVIGWSQGKLLDIAEMPVKAQTKAERFSDYLKSEMAYSRDSSLTEEVLTLAHLMPELNLQDICTRLNVSRSNVDRNFIRIMGVAPGKYFGLMRIYNVLMAMVKKPEATLQAVANFFNYSDHSHLIKDFRKRLGMSPREFKERELEVLKRYLESTPANYIDIKNL